MSLVGKVWRRAQEYLPVQGFYFNRPIVVFQSDDWGRAGLRDQEGCEQLKAAGVALGECPYDLYTLETADDLAALSAVLNRHRDSTGRPASMVLNFILCNLNLRKMRKQGYRQIDLLPLTDGFPEGWSRPGLVEGYREGIAAGVFYPALHGSTHFCRPAIERNMTDGGEPGLLLRALWDAGTPYIHWRMPWVGYEYWDPEQPEDERFLPRENQEQLIGQSVGAFAKFFATLPRSACAPGYRANAHTHSGWAQHGIRIAQNGPGTMTPPHMDRHETLHLYRNVEFEPAVDPDFAIDTCMSEAQACFERGLPAIISVHSINFHSTVRNFRASTLELIDRFLSVLRTKYPDLLYLHDGDLHSLVSTGSYEAPQEAVRVNVTRKKFQKATVANREG